ncbi:hypothetical protein J6590_077229 [Homalodisca vitripennis]|nr:hypothetical protein J6590_086723 [Homalodisca vitripennis]KAG8315116.1 hypothetical protein J6590_077229 [Homalodisca vitripennis]
MKKMDLWRKKIYSHLHPQIQQKISPGQEESFGITRNPVNLCHQHLACPGRNIITGNPFDHYKSSMSEFIYEVITAMSNQNYPSKNGKERKTPSEEIRKMFRMPLAAYELVRCDQEDGDNERLKKRSLPLPLPQLRTTMSLHLPTIPDTNKC